MFTLDQIKEAHSKVKSGESFPAYIADLKKLGITYYVTFVFDGHTDFYGTKDIMLTSPAKYSIIAVAELSDEVTFKSDLKAHQAGKTDFPTFCSDSAKSGIEKWAVSMDEMTCTYFDKADKKVLVEEIPG